MVLVQNKYKNTLVGVLRTQITFVTHSSPSCYVTLRTQVIRLNSGNLSPQKTDSGVFIIILQILMSLAFSDPQKALVVWPRSTLCHFSDLIPSTHVLLTDNKLSDLPCT